MSSWYINFCAPFIPNDDTINFHRYLQASTLLVYLICGFCFHSYYQLCVPQEGGRQKSKGSSEQQSESSDISQGESESAKNQSEQSSELSSEQKDVSLKIRDNDSCVELKKDHEMWKDQQSSDKSASTSKFIHKMHPFEDRVTLAEVQAYFPIVVGHFAIAMGGSIMYTPYAEQSISCILYFVLTWPLLFANSKRWNKITLVIWALMTIVILFLLSIVVLEIGQSNWDIINLQCFAEGYTSFYF